MTRNKNLLALEIVFIISLIVVIFSNSTHGDQKKYEIASEITLPEYQNDLGRVINAYERMMDRLMYMTERNFSSISYDVKDISNKLVSIDSKLTELSARMARIEKTLGVEQSEKPDGIKSDANNNSNIEQVKSETER